MADILIFDPTTKAPLKLLRSAHTPDFIGRDDVLINPILPTTDLRLLQIEPDLTLRLKTTEELQQAEQEKQSIDYRIYREREYPPIGDQLDALLKQFSYMQMTFGRTDIQYEEKVARCLNCVKELDAIIAKWLAVKAKYPKPEVSS